MLFIKVSLPSLERCCLFHKDKHFLNLSSTTSHTLDDLKGEPKGKPKEEVGSFPTLYPITKTIFSKESILPTRIASLLSLFTFKPEITLNHKNTQLKYLNYSLLTSQNKSVSSANRKWSISLPIPQLLPTLNPSMKPPLLDLNSS